MRYILFNTGNREVKLRMNIEHTLILERYKQITPYNLISYIYEHKLEEEMTMYILKEALAPYTDEYDSLESVSEIVDEYFDNGGNWWTLNNVLILVFQEAGFYDKLDEEDEEKDIPDDITMEKITMQMLKVCLEAGIVEDDFWEMTYKEIVNYMKAYKKRREVEFKELVTINHLLGDLIGMSVSRLFSKDAKYPSVVEMFPNLYKEEQEALKEQKQKELNERIKANMMAFGAAYKNNKELKEIYKDELND